MMFSLLNRPRSLAFAPLLAAAALTLTGCVTTPLVEESRAIDADYFEGMGLDVKTANGDIEVLRADVPAVQISATLKARTEDRLQAARIVTEHEDGMLVIRVEWPNGKRESREGCSFTIHTPGVYGAKLKTGNGAIVLTGAGGDAELDTSNGRITVTDHAGDVSASTSNGRVTCERVSGNVRAGTSNGRIRMIDVDGSVDAGTSNGGVHVELSHQSTGPVHIDTSNGSVKLVLGSHFIGELELTTSNGGISYETTANVKRVNSRRNRATLQFGEGGPDSSVSTSNGSIDVDVLGEG